MNIRALIHMCQYSPKTEDLCLQAMKQVAKAVFENDIYHHSFMEIMARAY